MPANLCHDGEPLPEPIEGVDGAGVVVDPTLAFPAVPVLAQPREVQVERAGGLRNNIYRRKQGRGPRTSSELRSP